MDLQGTPQSRIRVGIPVRQGKLPSAIEVTIACQERDAQPDRGGGNDEIGKRNQASTASRIAAEPSCQLGQFLIDGRHGEGFEKLLKSNPSALVARADQKLG